MFFLINVIYSAEQIMELKKNELESSFSDIEFDRDLLEELEEELQTKIELKEIHLTAKELEENEMVKELEEQKIINPFYKGFIKWESFFISHIYNKYDSKYNSQYNSNLYFEEFLLLWQIAINQSHSNEPNPSKTWEENENIVRTFTFEELGSNYYDFELLCNGVDDNFSYKEIITWMGGCFPNAKNKTDLVDIQKIIEENCKRAIHLILAAEKVASKTKKYYDRIHKLKDILLSVESIIPGLDKIDDLLASRVKILRRSNRLMKEQIKKQLPGTEEVQYIGLNRNQIEAEEEKKLEKYIKECELHEKIIDKIKKTKEKIINLHREINKFHEQGVPFIISKKFVYRKLKEKDEKVDKFVELREKVKQCKSVEEACTFIEEKNNIENMKEFKTLIEKINKKCLSLLDNYEDLKLQYEVFFYSHGLAIKKLNRIFQKSDENFREVSNEIFRIRFLFKVFLTINQFSKYMSAMTPEQFIESIKQLTSNELVGFAFFVYIGKLWKKYFLKKCKSEENLKFKMDEKYLMENVINIMEKHDLDLVKKILKCAEQMDLDIFKENKEIFLKIFDTKELETLENKKSETVFENKIIHLQEIESNFQKDKEKSSEEEKYHLEKYKDSETKTF